MNELSALLVRYFYSKQRLLQQVLVMVTFYRARTFDAR
jgi:hypothetical protein